MSFWKSRIRRIRFWYHLIGAYLLRYRLRIVIFFVTFITISISVHKAWSTISRTNYVSIGYVGSYSLESIPTQALLLATQSLVTVDENDRPLPLLASHWQVSEDGKTYIVFLKDNLQWHNGSQVNANDISIAIKNVSITALNNKAIQFQLPNPIYSFPLALDKPVFKAGSFYGVGQFRIVDIDQVDNIVKKISLVPKDESLPRVDIKFYPTEQQAETALKIGEIKSAIIANAKEFENWPNLQAERKIENKEIVTAFYNNNDPILSSRELRQALNYAINKSDFDGQVATGPISPRSWAFNEQTRRYDYNASRAKELIAKSGSSSLKIVLSFSPSLLDVADSIKRDWEAVGFEVTLRAQKSIPKDFQVFLALNKLSPDPDQYSLWHSSQVGSTNITGFKDAKIDKLLEDGRSISDEAKRRDIYFEFQRFLVEDAPAAFLYYPYKYQVTYKNSLSLIGKLPR